MTRQRPSSKKILSHQKKNFSFVSVAKIWAIQTWTSATVHCKKKRNKHSYYYLLVNINASRMKVRHISEYNIHRLCHIYMPSSVQINHFKNVFKVKFMGSNFVVSIIISNITSSGYVLFFNRIDNFFFFFFT